MMVEGEPVWGVLCEAGWGGGTVGGEYDCASVGPSTFSGRVRAVGPPWAFVRSGGCVARGTRGLRSDPDFALGVVAI